MLKGNNKKVYESLSKSYQGVRKMYGDKIGSFSEWMYRYDLSRVKSKNNVLKALMSIDRLRDLTVDVLNDLFNRDVSNDLTNEDQEKVLLSSWLVLKAGSKNGAEKVRNIIFLTSLLEPGRMSIPAVESCEKVGDRCYQSIDQLRDGISECFEEVCRKIEDFEGEIEEDLKSAEEKDLSRKRTQVEEDLKEKEENSTFFKKADEIEDRKNPEEKIMNDRIKEEKEEMDQQEKLLFSDKPLVKDDTSERSSNETVKYTNEEQPLNETSIQQQQNDSSREGSGNAGEMSRASSYHSFVIDDNGFEDERDGQGDLTTEEISERIQRESHNNEEEDGVFRLDGNVNVGVLSRDESYMKQLQDETGLRLQGIKIEITDEDFKKFRRGNLNPKVYVNFLEGYACALINNNKSPTFETFAKNLQKFAIKDLAGDVKTMVNTQKTLPIEYVEKFMNDLNAIRKDDVRLDLVLKTLESEYFPRFDPSNDDSYFQNQALKEVQLEVDGETYIFGTDVSKEEFDTWDTKKQSTWKEHIRSINRYPPEAKKINDVIKDRIIKRVMYECFEKYKYFKLFNVGDLNVIDTVKRIKKGTKEGMKNILDAISKSRTNDKGNSIYSAKKLLFRTGGSDGVVSSNEKFLSKLSFKYDNLRKRYDESEKRLEMNTASVDDEGEMYDNHYNDATYIKNYANEGLRNPRDIQIEEENGMVRNAKIKNAVRNVIKNKLLF